MNRPKYPTPSRPVEEKKSRDVVSPFLTSQEAATYLRKSVAAIHNMVHRRQLIAYKPGGKLLFKKDDLDHWVYRSKVQVGYGN